MNVISEYIIFYLSYFYKYYNGDVPAFSRMIPHKLFKLRLSPPKPISHSISVAAYLSLSHTHTPSFPSSLSLSLTPVLHFTSCCLLQSFAAFCVIFTSRNEFYMQLFVVSNILRTKMQKPIFSVVFFIVYTPYVK